MCKSDMDINVATRRQARGADCRDLAVPLVWVFWRKVGEICIKWVTAGELREGGSDSRPSLVSQPPSWSGIPSLGLSQACWSRRSRRCRRLKALGTQNVVQKVQAV